MAKRKQTFQRAARKRKAAVRARADARKLQESEPAAPAQKKPARRPAAKKR